MKIPSMLHHIFNADSRKVSFGWWLCIISTWLTAKDEIGESTWLICAVLATILIGGGTVVDEIIKVGRAWIEAKSGDRAARPAPKETPNAGAQPGVAPQG